jgi:DNA-binding response OmpR family regulator
VNKILIANRDRAYADVLAYTLTSAGFEVVLAHDGLNALQLVTQERPNLVMLDWELSTIEGIEVCKQIRAQSGVAIIMLTTRDDDDAVVTAFECGIDDYIIRPYSPRRLVARLRAVLRRSIDTPREFLRVGSLALDLNANVAQWGAEATQLTRLEARLLQALMSNPGHVVTNESLIARVWGPDGASRTMLKQLVYRLRSKLDPAHEQQVVIRNIPQTGYILDPLE